VATLLLKTALALQKTPPAPFGDLYSSDGGENGLLGSKYFAAHRTVPATEIVANVNVDMFLPLFPLRSLIVQGLEESNLAMDLRAVGKELQLQILSDPEPERNAFTRSDQYSFIQRGVPSVSLKVGFEKASPQHEIVKRWRAERYHAPSDDLQQPVDFQAAADFNAGVLARCQSYCQSQRAATLESGQFLPAVCALKQSQPHFITRTFTMQNKKRALLLSVFCGWLIFCSPFAATSQAQKKNARHYAGWRCHAAQHRDARRRMAPARARLRRDTLQPAQTAQRRNRQTTRPRLVVRHANHTRPRSYAACS
jgi:hypothetical protein